MAFKTLVVEATGTDRQKSSLGEAIDQAVAGFLESEKAELTDMKVDADFSHGQFGKALVTVIYKTAEKKKEGVK